MWLKSEGLLWPWEIPEISVRLLKTFAQYNSGRLLVKWPDIVLHVTVAYSLLFKPFFFFFVIAVIILLVYSYIQRELYPLFQASRPSTPRVPIILNLAQTVGYGELSRAKFWCTSPLSLELWLAVVHIKKPPNFWHSGKLYILASICHALGLTACQHLCFISVLSCAFKVISRDPICHMILLFEWTT